MCGLLHLWEMSGRQPGDATNARIGRKVSFTPPKIRPQSKIVEVDVGGKSPLQDVPSRRQLVQEGAFPISHLSSRKCAQNDDLRYQCWSCSSKTVEQLQAPPGCVGRSLDRRICFTTKIWASQMHTLVLVLFLRSHSFHHLSPQVFVRQTAARSTA